MQFVITQLFFDNAHYFDFVARAREAGVDVPIIPGVMPVTSYEGIKRMTTMTHFPSLRESDSWLEVIYRP